MDIRKLKKCSTEDDLIKIAQEIDDRVTFRDYNSEQILNLVNEIVKIDLRSVKYGTKL